MIKLAVFLSILTFVSCNNRQTTPQKKDSTISKTDSVKQVSKFELKPYQVIIKPGEKEFKEIFGDKYSQRTPDDYEIGIAELQMDELFYNMKRGTVNYLLDRSPGDYNRQFVGALNENGEKIIWINCFCKPEKENEDWKHKLIIAMGGGTCFFNFKVNVTKNEYYDFKVNGNK
jgi:hypothetical protein